MLRDLLQCEGHAGPQAYLYVDGQDGHRSVALRCPALSRVCGDRTIAG